MQLKTVLFGLSAAIAGLLPPRDAAGQVSFNFQPVVTSGLSQPIGIYNAGDGTDRLFVIEKTGKIKIIFSNGTMLPTPFLDIGPDGLNLIVTSGERGLLGLAFHPLYASNGFFYVHYSERVSENTQISRFTVSAGDPNLANPASEFSIIGSPPIDDDFASNHNGGSIEFSPIDGFLYIGLGDGGNAGDPSENGQDLNSYFGKILRIDVDGASPYAIPNSNPFVGLPGHDEIYAYGFRNPYRFSFDSLTGRLFCGDVGQDAREEIDLVVAGGNYGWDDMEGSICFEPMVGCATAGRILPIFDYAHLPFNVNGSVTGGLVYRGGQYPNLEALYFCGDFLSGEIFVLRETSLEVFALAETLDTSFQIAGFGADEGGELYFCNFGGGVYKITGIPVDPLPSSNQGYWILY